MTRQHEGLATRRAIFADHGGEMPFWLAWVHGEIDGAVQDWVRNQARHDPALKQDLDSIEAPTARSQVTRRPGGHRVHDAEAARPGRVARRRWSKTSTTSPTWSSKGRESPVRQPRSAPLSGRRAASRGSPPSIRSPDDPHLVLRQAIETLSNDERTLLFAQWQGRAGSKESLARVLLPEDDQPPTRGELSEKGWRLRRAEGRLRQALGSQRDLLWTLGPDRLWQLLADEYLAAASDGRASVSLSVPDPPRRKRRSAADIEVYRRVGRSLFRLLAEVEIPLPGATRPARPHACCSTWSAARPSPISGS